MENIVAKVEFTGQNKTGTSMKSGSPKPWWRLGAYVQVPGLLHPQAIEFFCNDATQLKAPGLYNVPCATRITDGRIHLEPDLTQAVQATQPAAKVN
jgi:hypothetical protein